MSHKTQESNTSCLKVRGFLVNLFCDLRVTAENTYFSSLCSYLQQLCAFKNSKKNLVLKWKNSVAKEQNASNYINLHYFQFRALEYIKYILLDL